MRLPAAVLAIFAAFAGVIGAACTSETAQEISVAPNVLLLVAEDLSPRIGAFGDSLAQTPNIDALAAAGVRYTNAFTTAGVCAPSRAALIIGQHQISFGAHHMRTWNGPLGAYYAQPAPEVRAFPELLRAHGYFTFTDTKLDYQFSNFGDGSGPFTIWDREGVSHTAWRERAEGQPFFGLINFAQTHESGVMRSDGQPHSETHAANQRRRREQGLVAPEITDPGAVELPPYYPDLPEVRADLARHYDNIRRMDEQVGDVLEALRQDGLWDSTIVIWTTDHGDGLPRAKRELYDSGIHVPLVLHIPEALRESNPGWRADPGSVDDRLISFVDLAPAILRFAGVDPPQYLHGESFLTVERDSILASRDRVDTVMDRQRALRDRRFKYIRSWYPEVPGGHALDYRDNLDMVRAWQAAWAAGTLNEDQSRWFEPAGAEQLYDLERDPHELDNLAVDEASAEVLGRMRESLAQQLEQHGDMGALDELSLRERLLDDGEIPVTPVPTWRLERGLVHVTGADGASIGYRLTGELHWRLYTEPLAAASGPIEIKAVRYGWRESGVVAVEP
jgi:N-sulfoglucosamine sulfohydrolase